MSDSEVGALIVNVMTVSFLIAYCVSIYFEYKTKQLQHKNIIIHEKSGSDSVKEINDDTTS